MLAPLAHASVFTGIGGFDLAARWMGWRNVFQVENEPHCQRVLHKNFPLTSKYLDIYEFNGREYTGQIDVFTGGFPCQPFSNAGKRLGDKDNRYLWPEMFRVIGEVRPPWVVVENVPGLLTWQNGILFERVLLDLESEGYQVQSFSIPACSQEAPHIRQRIWIVAHAKHFRRKIVYRNATKSKHGAESTAKDHSHTQRIGCERNHGGGARKQSENRYTQPIQFDTNPNSFEFEGGKLKNNRERTQPYDEQPTRRHSPWSEHWAEAASRLCRMDARVPHRLDRLRGLGNSIVPQVAYDIFKAIQATEDAAN